jgi:fructuronate reductase
MVDSITPATDDALRARVKQAIGLYDAWPIQREAFTQWVIERHEHRGGPDWEAAGVTLADAVTPFERAKLRILNASHSSLAYQGILKGLETVADAMADPELAGFVRDFMEKDVSPGLKLPPSFDLKRYREDVLKRFRNPAMRHLLAQIAWDGSQKLPNRLFGLIEEALAEGRSVARPARAVAAWCLFIRKRGRDGEKLVDPLAPLLLETASRANNDPAHDVELFLGLDAVFPASLAGDATFKSALIEAYSELLR